MKTRMAKTDIIFRIRTNILEAKKEDFRNAAKHQKDEAAMLDKFRAAIQTAMKWDYKKAKDNYFNIDVGRGPSCPSLYEPRLQEILKRVSADTRTHLMIGLTDDIYEAAFWIAPSKKPKVSICS